MTPPNNNTDTNAAVAVVVVVMMYTRASRAAQFFSVGQGSAKSSAPQEKKEGGSVGGASDSSPREADAPHAAASPVLQGLPAEQLPADDGVCQDADKNERGGVPPSKGGSSIRVFRFRAISEVDGNGNEQARLK